MDDGSTCPRKVASDNSRERGSIPLRYQRSSVRVANAWRLFRYRNKRHAFVVRRLLRWYQEGADVDHKILALATYLGHARVTDTYWYCTAVPELLASTSQRFERFAHRASERPS